MNGKDARERGHRGRSRTSAGVQIALTASILLLVCALVVAAGGGVLAAPQAQDPLRYIDFSVPARQTHVKLDTALSKLVEAEQVAPEGVSALAQARGMRLEAGRVLVQLKVAPGTQQAVNIAVTQAGGAVTGQYQETLQAWLPPEQIEALTARADVYRVQTPARLIELEPVNQSSIVSEGLAALNGEAWHASGSTGEGVKVAVVDGGFYGYQSLIGVELPSTVTVKNFVDGETDADVGRGLSEHGTACAEIVHDVAPGVELYLVKIATDVDLAEAVNYVMAQGIDIV